MVDDCCVELVVVDVDCFVVDDVVECDDCDFGCFVVDVDDY